MSFNEDIKAYIDGELSPERMEEVRNALDRDPALMEEYKSMKDISQKLQSLIRQPQVKGVEQTKAAVAPAQRFRWREGIAVAATLAVIGVIAYPLVSRSRAMSGSDAETQAELAKVDKGLEGLSPSVDAMKSKSYEGVGGRGMDERRFGAGAGGATALKEEGFNGLADGAMAGPMKSRGGAVYGEPPVPADSMAGFTMPQSPTESRPTRAGDDKMVVPSLMTNDAELETRFVIKDGSFTILVKDVREAMDKATQLARTNGGYIEASNVDDTGDKKGLTTGYVTIRLPQKNFEAAVEKIRSYGEIRSENTSGDDVTGQVTDIEARIRTLKAEEESYRELLRRATRLGDVLDIKDRISQVRQQIESYDSQRMMLSRLSALSTISLRFTTDKEAKQAVPKVGDEEDSEWFEDTKLAALGILKGVGKFIAQVGTFLFILLPVWVPLALFALWFRRRAFVPTTQG